jgi:pyrroline-5-carboxylate reductase
MKVAFVGGGNMASALIGGQLANGLAAADVRVVEPDAGARERLARRFGLQAVASPDAGVAGADVLVFAVKPQQMRAAAQAVAAVPRDARAAGAEEALVISVAAGIRIADLSRWLGGAKRLIRAMPNTPALVQAGITGLYAPTAASAGDRAVAEQMLRSVGTTLWFDREEDLDAVTAVSGSGPAYVFYGMEALEAAALALGLDAGKARALAVQTYLGAARLAAERGIDPAALRAEVTSRGGTTERALSVLEAADVRGRYVEAVKAACERSRELGVAFGKD